MSTQVNILPQLNSAPNPRAILGLVAEGFRLIGFAADKLRLDDPMTYGRAVGLAELELLYGLSGTERETDGELISRLAQDYDVEAERLKRIANRFRGLLQFNVDGADDFAWRPPVHTHESVNANPSFTDQLAPSRILAVHFPLLFRVGKSGFEHVNHHGGVDLSLTVQEISALRHLTEPATIDVVMQRIAQGEERLSAEAVRPLLERLLAVQLLRSFEPGDPAFDVVFPNDSKPKHITEQGIKRLFSAIERAEEHNPRRPGTIPIYPVNVEWSIAPLALGFLFASARQYEGGRLMESFDLRPNWLTNQSVPVPQGHAIMLHSHYIWNSHHMLACAARVKAANPLALNIHGGPDVPKYEPDVEHYFATHPYVDIAVHGEGEVTICEILAALEQPMLQGGPLDLTPLDSVAGLSYRGLNGRPVRTADRERIENLDDIPSPYLTGEFEVFAEAGAPNMILESNRGCPYGCTFCDWGSATASKIRQFDLDRIFAELEWSALNRFEVIAFADANFGSFARDVDIAQRTADLKRTHGYPQQLGTNYAKNSVKHLKPIVEALVKGDIIAKGLLSLQSMDEDTLSVINRKNIKLEKYEALAAEFRANNLPLYIDLMMGLPGSTLKSFQGDLQQCIDREVFPKIHPTQLLVNSPMNEPSYREKYAITVAPSEILTSCASFSEADFGEMHKFRRIFLVADKFGILRHALRYARQETGQREIDLLARLMSTADNEGDRWPALRFTLLYIPTLMVPPVDWAWFLADLHRYFVEQLGIANDAALDSALRAQHAMLPAPERRFPDNVELPCDYAAWYSDVLAARAEGHLDDWPTIVPPLRTYGPGTLTVTDPHYVCNRAMGRHYNLGAGWSIWELSSAIARPSDGAM